MNDSWTFSKKLTASLAILVALVMVLAGVALQALERAVEEKDAVATTYGRNLLDARTLETLLERRVAEVRRFLLLSNSQARETVEEAIADFGALLATMRGRSLSENQGTLLERIVEADRAHREALTELFDGRSGDAGADAYLQRFERLVLPRFQVLRDSVQRFRENEVKLRDVASQAATLAAERASSMLTTTAVITLLLALGLGWMLTTALTRQVGASVQQLHSSALELQTASNQQSTSCKEQVSAVQEASTTMRELLATSRQIGESAQHVASVAQETRAATESGEKLVEAGREANEVVRSQMEKVVQLMLELGERSRRIGSVLALVNELAEQTNILSVNATIEAAGAGDHGGRFAAVAEEIRKLSGRVSHSTREIQELVEEIRSSVNVTVMATESGSKAVHEGTARFEDFATSFRKIAELVANTAEAAKEIELSTNQQRTAAEQVTIAVEQVSQAAVETETGTRQVQQTSEQLTELSQDLGRLVQAQRVA